MSEKWQSDKHPGYARHSIAVISIVAAVFLAVAAFHTSRRAASEADKADKAGQPPVQVQVQPAMQPIQTPQHESETNAFVEEMRKLREKSDKR